jgi:hypothetical protein
MTAYTPGDFRFITGSYPSADELKDAYDAITKAEAWELMAQDPGEGGYMFSKTIDLSRVHKHMRSLDSHSGASYGIMMRSMQYIAVNGWEAYVQLHTNRSSQSGTS